MTGPVLASIDLSHPIDAERVLRKADQLAQLEGKLLAVVTVMPDLRNGFVSTFFSEDHGDAILKEGQKALHAFIAKILGHDDDIKHVIRMGNIYEEVLATAQKLSPSLIVMGAHKPGLPEFLMGPNAARIARHATCSVYIMRD